MNLLVDPSLEIQSPAWVPDANGLGAFSTAQAHAGTWSLRIRRANVIVDEVGIWISGTMTQSAIPLQVGEVYNISAWVFVDLTSATHGLRIELDKGSGSFTVSTAFVSLPLGWQLVTMAPITATGGVGQIRLSVIGPITAVAFVHVDDVVWDWPAGDLMARRSKHTAYNAVITRLKTIAGGATYHLDLGQRVYPLLFLPEEKAAVPLPYACFPLIDTFNIVEGDRATVEHQWEANVHLFITDTSSDPLSSLSSELAAKAHDDIIKAFKADTTLGGACQDLALLGGASEAGALVDGKMYAELIFRIRIKQIVGTDVLGP